LKNFNKKRSNSCKCCSKAKKESRNLIYRVKLKDKEKQEKMKQASKRIFEERNKKKNF